MNFVVSPISAAWLATVRRDLVDDAGDRFEPFIAEEGGAQLRCCLRNAETGERLALVAYRPAGTAGAYREIGPVFVHADPCDGYREPGQYPAGFRERKQVLRAYDEAGRIADAIMVEGPGAEAGIRQLLERPEVATVHSRAVLYGCFSFAIDRA
ncbi:hypothetical protein BJ973_003941 [Actinoplanes tereljensis]|uniref:DUF1203 domain-containing protein n=1 Tax=Paractinoplanes tereljensis TaxID=571912 RepID=A0A919NYH6_9ACTN|nr:DUF1203 domain-containing protein [Actinoplanes tereljensis]GIF25662.1 hypothetical protein Ate02nite_83920 [Actinoplanes tereljensis]